MKTSCKLFILASILILILYNGCQPESEDPYTPDQAFKPDSEVAGLIQRVAMNDGSVDNIIDHSSCISLKLPLTVTVNDTELIIDDEEDFYNVEHMVDKSEDDEDVIEIIFPVTVIQADYSELILNNEDDLEVLIDQCPENEPDDDIECIDFIYPVTLYIFDSRNQLSDVIAVKNDRDLYDFFKKFDDDELASFHYPFHLRDLSSNGFFTIDNKLELENYISDAEGICDEDDDNDHNDDDADVAYLRSVLMFGKWVISRFDKYNEDKTFIFHGYTFNFLENGLVEASTENESFSGSWYANGDYGLPELEFDFDSESPLDQLEKDWEVAIDWFGVSASNIFFIFITGNGPYHLELSRPSDDAPFSNLTSILGNGTWVVTGYTNSGKDETSNYDGLLFNFEEGTVGDEEGVIMEDGTVVVAKDDEAVEGTWSFDWDLAGPFNFILDFGELVPLNVFNNDWELVSVNYKRVEFFHFNEEDGTGEGLIFQRIDM